MRYHSNRAPRRGAPYRKGWRMEEPERLRLTARARRLATLAMLHLEVREASEDLLVWVDRCREVLEQAIAWRLERAKLDGPEKGNVQYVQYLSLRAAFARVVGAVARVNHETQGWWTSLFDDSVHEVFADSKRNVEGGDLGE